MYRKISKFKRCFTRKVFALPSGDEVYIRLVSRDVRSMAQFKVTINKKELPGSWSLESFMKDLKIFKKISLFLIFIQLFLAILFYFSFPLEIGLTMNFIPMLFFSVAISLLLFWFAQGHANYLPISIGCLLLCCYVFLDVEKNAKLMENYFLKSILLYLFLS